MNRMALRGIALAVALNCIGTAGARTMCSNEVEAAAVAWLRTSVAARSIVPGRGIASMEKRGGVWLIRLSPSGYVIMAMSDEASPVVAFSGKPFVEPEKGTAFHVVLHGAETGLARLADANVSTGSVRTARSVRSSFAAASDDRATHRKARWETLLGVKNSETNSVRRAMQSSSVPSSGILVAPFLPMTWNQWQPYNDFAPVYDADGTGVYRGRCPCGCVATAAAQTFAYWKWPAHADGMSTMTGSFGGGDWLMRFAGDTPLQWTGLPTNDIGNACWSKGYDLRGSVAESVRYPLARLFFLCDALGEMDFMSGGSSSSFYTVAARTPWYESGRWVNPSTDFNDAVTAIKADLTNRIPVQVSVPGHAVVGCGWAEDSGDRFIYLNYGWGGSNDGYYNMDDPYSDAPIQEACVGFKPKRMVQVTPIPSVVEDSVRIEWSLPECYRGSTSGFSISSERRELSLSSFADSFSTLTGRVTGEGVSSVTDPEHGCTTTAVKMVATKDASYELPGGCVLTSRSVLTFEYFSFAMLSHELRVEMNADGAWVKVSSPRLSDYNEITAKRLVEVPLCEFGGKSVRFRIVCDYQDGGYYSDGYFWVSNFKVGDVNAYSVDSVLRVGGQDRVASISGLRAGTDYRLTVKSDEMPACDAAVLLTRTAGEGNFPVPGEVRYEQVALAYGDGTLDDHWSIDGNVVSSNEIKTSQWQGGFSFSLPGPLTVDSHLSFGWTASGYYDRESYDRIVVSFEDSLGSTTNVWESLNAENATEVREVDVSLGGLSGKTGIVTVRFEHTHLQYPDQGMRFYRPQLRGIARLSLDPEAKTERRHFAASADLSILSVASDNGCVEEGFFVECARGFNLLRVQCSAGVRALTAASSQLTLLPDDRVTVLSRGSGNFLVIVDGSDIPNASDRSRMILTLNAKDSNGTSLAKDLVLRFSSETSPATCGFIRFLPNGGSGEMSRCPIVPNAVATLPLSSFSLKGRRFAGWACSNGKRYDDGCLVFNLAEPGETVTMTAIWE